MATSYTLKFLPVAELRPHEAVKEKKAANFLRFLKRTKWFPKPILVDERSRVILDGHHRYWVCRELGCRTVPCYCVDYLSDATIRVLPRRPDIPVSKEEVIRRGIAGDVFPHKTTKHVYEIPEAEMERSFSLKELQ